MEPVSGKWSHPWDSWSSPWSRHQGTMAKLLEPSPKTQWAPHCSRAWTTRIDGSFGCSPRRPWHHSPPPCWPCSYEELNHAPNLPPWRFDGNTWGAWCTNSRSPRTDASQPDATLGFHQQVSLQPALNLIQCLAMAGRGKQLATSWGLWGTRCSKTRAFTLQWSLQFTKAIRIPKGRKWASIDFSRTNLELLRPKGPHFVYWFQQNKFRAIAAQGAAFCFSRLDCFQRFVWERFPRLNADQWSAKSTPHLKTSCSRPFLSVHLRNHSRCSNFTKATHCLNPR